MGAEGPINQGEGNDIEREKGKLEANLDELSGHLEELESSDPSRKEKVIAFVRDKYPILVGTLIGLGAEMMLRGGTIEDFIFAIGVGGLTGAWWSAAKRQRLGIDKNETEAKDP